MAKNVRLQSLDVVRGLTVAAMIMVNNGYRDSFEMLRHAAWNGLTVSDFVFPFFLFIMGVSLFLSFSKTGFQFSWPKFLKILKRSVLLLVLGIAINWLEMACHGNALDFSELRFWAVLQRIAICYFVAALLAMFLDFRFILPLSFMLLIAYGFIIVTGNGYSEEKALNILYITDSRLFGEAHLYHKSAVDPEGLVSTMASLANVLFGFYCGMRMKDGNNIFKKSVACFVPGVILLVLGFLVSFFLPVNKHIWSPSFALITSGACALFLGVFVKWIDGDRISGTPVNFFKVFGANALLLYITSEIMAIFFGFWGVSDAIFRFWSAIISVPPVASLFYAFTFVFLNWIIGYPLWRKHIFIKL
ncbi:MAG: DUF5009 domain-containing protein [Muribaculaceae bacterium]|nr:DUF5009 domain-containing protein [Muribaculaceae bacterium]